jgi:Flp pilus assembly protein CpaB
MQLTTPKPNSKRGPGPLGTRNGTLAVAGILALLAGAAMLLFLREYRKDLTGSDPVRVLVARSLVAKGTPGDVVAGDRLYRVIKVRDSQLKEGALSDPAELRDKVTVTDIDPGHQLQAIDFESADGHPGNRLSGFARAMTVPVDVARGMIGKIETGDRVDVITTSESVSAGGSLARIAARNVLVISIPSDGGDGSVDSEKRPATIRVDDTEAASIAAAADGGEVWLVLRPAVGARSNDSVDAVAQALQNGRPVQADINIDAKVSEGR